MILFLTSSLDAYEKDENGVKHPHNFGNENGILDNFKKYIKKRNEWYILVNGTILYSR